MTATFTRASDFVPDAVDASRWESLAPLYRELIDRDLRCAKCLERLILDRSELDAAASEAAAVLYIRMTCHTDDAEANRAYEAYMETVQPELKRVGFALDRKIAQSPHAADLDPGRYGVLLRNVRVGVELFREENVDLETKLSKLDQEYQQVCGAMTVVFRGDEKTIPQMARYNEDPDRAVREEAWLAVAERRFRDAERLEEIFERMLPLRHQVAVNAGFANYRDYMFKRKRRFDYTPQACADFADGLAAHVVPTLHRLNAERCAELGVDALRPWDLHVDPKGRPPLRPFDEVDRMVEGTSRIFHRMDRSLGALFDSLRGEGCLDLDSRRGKAPGGYQYNRDRSRQPFIFMNAAGVQRDVETILHEAGHAFHALLTREEPILAYRSEIPTEFAEVASMSMELAAHPFLDEFYAPAEADRARRVHLESMATLLPSTGMVDQFQHWMYTHPDHTRAERRAKWVELSRRFGADIDWSGMEHLLETGWHRILHIFEVPFYYIEYGIAQLGALQLWRAYRRDPGAAIRRYKDALALGGSRPLPELFAAAGLEFDFGPSMIQRLWSELDRELASLPS